MKNKRISIIGPFPEPLHGMTLCNEMLCNFLINEKDIDATFFDTTLQRTIKSKASQGKIQLSSVTMGIFNLLKLLVFILKSRSKVYYFTPPQSVYGFLRLIPSFILAKLVGGKVVVHLHGSRFQSYLDQSKPFLKGIVKYSFEFIDAFIVLGDSIKRSHSQLFTSKKVYVCENGVPIPSNKELKEKSLKTRVLFLSNLMKDKGIFEFLEALRSLDKDKFHIDIAGALEPSNKDTLESLLAVLGDNVIYHGVVKGSKKEKLLQNANIFVLPSYDEGQPLSILEAYSYKCTVLTTNAGGIPDIFSDDINGKLVEIGSSSSIHQALSSLNDAQLDKFSKNNYSKYISKYTEREFSLRILKILESF